MKRKIVVCSKNKAKNNAVRNALSDFFDDFEIVSLQTSSGVSETPVGDEEGLAGCKNRLSDAMLQVPNADIYIAMEGILNQNSFGTYLCGWTMIFDKASGNYISGCSAKVQIPEKIACKLNKDERLSKIVADYFGSTDEEISLVGTNGVLTHGYYTRTDEFINSVKCALSVIYKQK